MNSLKRTSMDKVEAILFDCDGVLLDTAKKYYGKMVEIMNKNGYEVTFEQICQRWYGKGADQIGEDLESEGYEDLKDILVDFNYKANHGNYINESFLVENIKQTLDKFEVLDLPKVVCSSNFEESIEHHLKSAKIFDYFNGHVGFDSPNSDHKPSPKIYLAGAAKLGVNPENCVVVEDSPTGVQAGVSAGCFVIGFTGTGMQKELLENAGASLIMQNMAELPSIIESLRNDTN